MNGEGDILHSPVLPAEPPFETQAQQDQFNDDSGRAIINSSEEGEVLSESNCSDYPLPWEVDSVLPYLSSVYAADSTLICNIIGEDAKCRAELIVKFANQNKKSQPPEAILNRTVDCEWCNIPLGRCQRYEWVEGKLLHFCDQECKSNYFLKKQEASEG